jgi:hypothetical protein
LRDTFVEIASEPVAVMVNGRRQMMTGLHAFLLNLQAQACRGDPRAMKLYADLCLKIGLGAETAGLAHEDLLDLLDAVPAPVQKPDEPSSP